MTIIALLIIAILFYSLIKNEVFLKGLKKQARIYINVILCLGAGAISYQLTEAIMLETKWNQLAQFAALIVGIIVCVLVIDSKLE
jgi:hypothetical protein